MELDLEILKRVASVSTRWDWRKEIGKGNELCA